MFPYHNGKRPVAHYRLAADVKILEGDALRKYILDYQKKYIQKLDY